MLEIDTSLLDIKKSAFYLKQTIQTLVLVTGTILALFIWEGHKGFSLGDEGFLWYGAQRVLTGEVPIRDFMAYDPGRYYWSAAIMALLNNNGIMALRSAIAIFEVLGLFLALMLLLRNSLKPISHLLLSVQLLILVLWMYPQHKIFDISLSIILIGSLTFLLQKPTSKRYFLTGVLVGLVAVFGRNHGLYGAVSSLCAMIYLALNREQGPRFIKGLMIWSIGVGLGYLPILLMLILTPGFAHAFWNSIYFLFEIKKTNLPLPIPWPWHVLFEHGSLIGNIRAMLVGVFFIALIIFGTFGLVWVFYQKYKKKVLPSLLVACIFLAIPYTQFAYSRAGISHLAQGMFPFLIGTLALLTNQPAKIKWIFTLLLCSASLLIMLPMQPGWQCSISHRCVSVNVTGSTLQVSPATAKDLSLLYSLAEHYAPKDRTFLATPYWPGAYAVLERKSPVWEIYALFPRNETFQREEIKRIEAASPGFVVVQDFPLDNQDQLRFRNTHPFLDAYINDHFYRLGGYTEFPAYRIYKREIKP